MSSSNVRGSLQDILESISFIREFIGKADFITYTNTRWMRSAVERELQIVTEAARRLGDDARRLCPEVDWRNARGLGNVLRHAYDGIDHEVIWDVIQVRLPFMEQAVRQALERLQHNE